MPHHIKLASYPLMTASRAGQWLILIGFITITSAAFVFTMTRVTLLPWYTIALSYGMMAPYQSTTPYNFAMVAEAVLEDGSRHPIDLKKYYPMSDPEMYIREYVPFAQWRQDGSGPTALAATYDSIARQILRREKADEAGIVRIELFWEQWPLSPWGFKTEYGPFKTERTLIASAA